MKKLFKTKSAYLFYKIRQDIISCSSQTSETKASFPFTIHWTLHAGTNNIFALITMFMAGASLSFCISFLLIYIHNNVLRRASMKPRLIRESVIARIFTVDTYYCNWKRHFFFIEILYSNYFSFFLVNINQLQTEKRKETKINNNR